MTISRLGIPLACVHFAGCVADCGAAPPQRPDSVNNGTVRMVRFRGIRPTDPDGRKGLRNPERGLRTETHIAKGKDAAWVGRAQKYAEHGLTLAQTYCYLTEFHNTDVSAGKLAQLQASFDALRSNGLKAVLRFAYEFDKDDPGPRLVDVRGHIAQLKPLLERNVDVICVVEAGFIGLWGEWHHSVHGLDKDIDAQRLIVMDLLDALPAERHIQLRRPRYKRAILGENTPWITHLTAYTGVPAGRIGFHSDYFVVQKHGWDITPGTKDFEQALSEGAFVWMGGEMPWGSNIVAKEKERDLHVDGFGAAKRMCEHHYGVFSLAHNFEEGGNEYDMKRWMTRPITAGQVREANLPLSDGYFEDESGAPCARSQFEYIRDHLGYRLELQDATFPAAIRPGQRFPYRISLANRGFSTLHNPRPVYVVLLDQAGAVIEQDLTGAKTRDWHPHQPGDPGRRPLRHEIAGEFVTPLDTTPGTYRLGLWMPDASASIQHDPRYAVRVANRDAPWVVSANKRYGVNVLGGIEVAE